MARDPESHAGFTSENPFSVLPQGVIFSGGGWTDARTFKGMEQTPGTRDELPTIVLELIDSLHLSI
jgi:hypothetical protein